MARQGTFQIANTLSAETYKIFDDAFKADKKTNSKSISAWILEQAKMTMKRKEFLKNNYRDFRVVSHAENLLIIEKKSEKEIITVRLEESKLGIDQDTRYDMEEKQNIIGFALATPELMLLEDAAKKKN